MQKLIETAKAVTWEEIESILRSDQRRGYKVDIETDATNAMDSETEKQQRMEFVGIMGKMLAESLPMIAQAPPQAAAALITLLKENAMFAAAAFKAGRTMEEAYDDAFTKLEEQAKAQASQPPKPSPEEQKLQAEMKAKQAEIQFAQQSKQMEFQFKEKEAQQTAQIEQQRFQHEAKLKEQELQHTMQLETFKARSEAQLRQYQADQDMQMRAQEFEANQVTAQQEASFKAQGMEQDAQLKEREFGHKQQIETDKMGFEREKHGQQMAFQQEQADRDLMAQGEVPSAEGKPAGGVAALVQSVSEAAQHMKEALAQMAALQSQIAEFQQRARQPARFIRGPDGRATHVENGHGTFSVERGPDGRAMGLMQ